MNKSRNLRHVSLAIIIIVSFSSCTMFKTPNFKDIQNVNITKFTGDTITFKAEAVFHNPNSVTLKVREMDVNVAVNGVEIGNVVQDTLVTLRPKSDAAYPFTLSFPSKKLFNNFMSALTYATSKKKLDVKYVGFVRVKYGIIPFKMPINYTGEIKFPGSK